MPVNTGVDTDLGQNPEKTLIPGREKIRLS